MSPRARRSRNREPFRRHRFAVCACSCAAAVILSCKAGTAPNNASIVLGGTTALFLARAGGSAPAAQSIQVTNGGEGTLTGLGVGTIAYGTGASGWLTATLSGTTAPATLALTATPTGLSAGTYTATVAVTARAANSPQAITVTFMVGQASGFPSGAFTSFSLSGEPWNVAISRQGLTYVTRVATDLLTRVDVAYNRAASSFPVGNGPYDVTFNAAGTFAYVTNLNDNTVGVINTASEAQDTTFAVPAGPVRVLLGPLERNLYVTLRNGGLTVLDAQSGAVDTTIQLGTGALNGLALTADRSRLYATSVGGGVTEINTATNRVTRSFSLGGRPQDVIVAPGDSLLYLADEGGWVTVWSLATWGARDSIPVPFAFGLALTPDGAQLFVAQTQAGSISIIDCASRKVVNVFPVLGEPRHLAMTPDGSAVVVANGAGLVQIGR